MRIGKTLLVLSSTGFFLAACGGDAPTGSITFGWKLGFGVACNDPAAQIDTIRARLFNPTTKKDVITPVTFSCGLFTGQLPKIALGTYNVILEGGTGAAFTQAVFTGAANGIVVTASKVSSIGEVRLAKVPPNANPSGLHVSWRFQSGKMCVPLGVAQVRITAWREKVYLEQDKVYECINSSQQLALQNGGYGLVAEGIDATGRVVTKAEQADVQLTSSGASVDFVLPDPVVSP